MCLLKVLDIVQLATLSTGDQTVVRLRLTYTVLACVSWVSEQNSISYFFNMANHCLSHVNYIVKCIS